ncbi:MAG: putative HAD-superfamily hydrolase [Firmicutes bacterium]|nr:putative HAD-superfamily hydrolase [Bacillota bacterium]
MKVAIFDFDGTLFESAAYWERIIFNYLNDRGITPPKNIMNIAKPLGISQTATLFKNQFLLKESEKEIVDCWRSKMGENYRYYIPLKDFAHQYIKNLRQTGINICLATAMERDFIIPALERTGILKLFDFIVTIDDVHANKNSPKIFLHCAEHFEVSPCECTVFEDSTKAAAICKEAGFQVIGVYDGVSKGDYAVMLPICDRFIFSFSELLNDDVLV